MPWVSGRVRGRPSADSGGTSHLAGAYSSGCQQRLLVLEGEQQQVDHPEGAVVRAERRPQGGSRTIEWCSPPSRGGWSRPRSARPPLELAAVELGLAQDVEPERRVGEQSLALGPVPAGSGRRRSCRRGSAPSSASSRSRPCSSGTWPSAGRSRVHHLRPGEVAEGEVAAGRRRPGTAAERAGGQVLQRVDERGVDPHSAVELGRRHDQAGLVRVLEVVEAAEVGDPVLGRRGRRRGRRSAAEKVNSSSRVPAAEVEDLVPVVGRRIIEWPSRNAATENSIGIVGTSVGVAFASKALRPLLKTRRRRRRADARQVVRADHPLVVLDDELARLLEALRRGGPPAGCRPPGCGSASAPGGSERPPGSRRCGVRDDRLALLRPRCCRRRAGGRSRPWRESARGDGLAHLQVAVVR